MSNFKASLAAAIDSRNEHNQATFFVSGWEFDIDVDNSDNTLTISDFEGETLASYNLDDGGFEYVLSNADDIWAYWQSYVLDNGLEA